MDTHICKNVKEHAQILNTPTSEVVNSNMKRRGKNSVVTVFIILSSLTKCYLKKYSKRLILLNVGHEYMVNLKLVCIIKTNDDIKWKRSRVFL